MPGFVVRALIGSARTLSVSHPRETAANPAPNCSTRLGDLPGVRCEVLHAVARSRVTHSRGLADHRRLGRDDWLNKAGSSRRRSGDGCSGAAVMADPPLGFSGSGAGSSVHTAGAVESRGMLPPQISLAGSFRMSQQHDKRLRAKEHSACSGTLLDESRAVIRQLRLSWREQPDRTMAVSLGAHQPGMNVGLTPETESRTNRPPAFDSADAPVGRRRGPDWDSISR